MVKLTMRQIRKELRVVDQYRNPKNELEAALHEMNHNKIQRELLKDNCDWFAWKMNFPHTSHMGGVWERQIKTVWSVLTRLLENHGNQLDDESLRTRCLLQEMLASSTATSRRILAVLEKELPTVPPDQTEVDHAYEER